MNNFGRYINEKLKAEGLNPNRLARLLNEDPALVHKVVKKGRSPSDRLIERIAQQLSIDPSILKGCRALDEQPEVLNEYMNNPSSIHAFTGAFHLLKSAIGKEPTLQEMADIIGAAPIAIEPMYLEYRNIALGKKVVNGEAHLKGTKAPPVKTVLLPIFGAAVPAGFPNSGDEWINGYFELPESLVTHPQDSFIIQTRGDSMVQAGILDGDNLIVDRAVEPKDKDIVVACLDGEFTVKRLRKKRGKIYLEPANDAYEAIDATGRIDCCYRVVGSYRQF